MAHSTPHASTSIEWSEPEEVSACGTARERTREHSTNPIDYGPQAVSAHRENADMRRSRHRGPRQDNDGVLGNGRRTVEI